MHSLLSDLGMANANARPNWRDDDSGVSDPSSEHDVIKARAEIARRLIAQARSQPDRIALLISSLNSFGEALIPELMVLIDEAKGFDDEGREIVRGSVRDYLSLHNSINAEDSKSQPANMDTLQRYFVELTPASSIMKHRWLFENAWVHVPDGCSGDLDKENKAREELRFAAIKQILDEAGLAGIAKLADASRDRRLVGYHLSRQEISNEELAPWLVVAFRTIA